MGKKMIKVRHQHRFPAMKNEYLGCNTFYYGQ